jgi:integrating conjugative element protein (TIGR03749 family)
MKAFIPHCASLMSALLLLMCHTALASGEPEHRVWNRTPIRIVLPVGQERRIDFPASIEVDLPSDIGPPVSQIEALSSGSLYWTARRPFQTRRVRIRSRQGRVYLLDVSAENEAPSHPIVVVDPVVQSPSPAGAGSSQASAPLTYDFVDLTRMAARALYAPERLDKPLPGVERFPVAAREVPLYRGSEVLTIPVAQWRTRTTPARYVTAVRVISDSPTALILDPRRIRGKWLTATFQHSVVGPKESTTAETTLYLISEQSFQESSQ